MLHSRRGNVPAARRKKDALAESGGRYVKYSLYVTTRPKETAAWMAKLDVQIQEQIGESQEALTLCTTIPGIEEVAAANLIAEKVMQKPRAIRRMTSAVLRRQWKRRLVEDLGFHIAHELLGMHLNKSE